MCGEKFEIIPLVIKTDKADIKFFSDMSYVDKGFSAEFEAFLPFDRMFTAFTICVVEMTFNNRHEN